MARYVRYAGMDQIAAPAPIQHSSIADEPGFTIEEIIQGYETQREYLTNLILQQYEDEVLDELINDDLVADDQFFEIDNEKASYKNNDDQTVLYTNGELYDILKQIGIDAFKQKFCKTEKE